MRLIPLLALATLAACTKQPDATNATVPVAKTSAVAAPAGQDWTQVVSKTPEGGYRMGNPAATLKLVEYGSRTCPTCGLFGREGMHPLETNYVKSGKVSYEFREFLVHGPPDLPASLLGRCAGAQPFFPLLEAMYRDQAQFETKLEDQAATAKLQASLAGAEPPKVANAWGDYMGYVDYVKQRGIPEAKARACLADTKEIGALVAMMNDAQTNKAVTGTPAFFLNGKLLENQLSWAQVEQSLKAGGA